MWRQCQQCDSVLQSKVSGLLWFVRMVTIKCNQCCCVNVSSASSFCNVAASSNSAPLATIGLPTFTKCHQSRQRRHFRARLQSSSRFRKRNQAHTTEYRKCKTFFSVLHRGAVTAKVNHFYVGKVGLQIFQSTTLHKDCDQSL